MTELQDMIDNVLYLIEKGAKKSSMVSDDYTVTAYTMADANHIRVDITITDEVKR